MIRLILHYIVYITKDNIVVLINKMFNQILEILMIHVIKLIKNRLEKMHTI